VFQASHIAPNISSLSADDLLYRKIAWRIMPILLLSYIIAYLDRVNVGFAKLQMMGDLKFSDGVYGLGAGIFFLGYFIFEIPSNIILHKVGARAWICRVLISWGIVSGATAFVRTPWEFYTARFLLGLAEAGFFPGMILYLTYWFPSHRRAKMMALLVAGNPVSGIIGGPVSGYILRSFAAGRHFAGWQWLFILEASPAVILGVVIFFYLDDRVLNAKWLSDAEKATVTADISKEAGSKTHRTVASAFASARLWLMCAILFSIVMGSYAISFWQPTILRETGVKDTFEIGLLTMVPYTLALVSMILVGRHSDKMRERRWHLVVPNILAALGFALCTQAGSSTGIAIAGLIMMVVGVVTALPMFWALPTSFLGGTGAASGIALVNSMGNLAGFFSPAIIGFLKTRTGTLNSGLFLVAGCHIAAVIMILVLVPAKLVNR
jgi:D-galactonate transporter